MATPSPTPADFPVDKAWEPLPWRFWDEESAAHLLRRIGFAATPESIKAALRGTTDAAITEAFAKARPLPMSPDLADFKNTVHGAYQAIRSSDPEEARVKRQELRRQDNDLFREFAMSWFDHARQPENSAREKLVLFLQDIFVVQRQSVRETHQLFSLQQTLRDGTGTVYPDLCKWVSREPAMIQYLNLNQSTQTAPNENFARELFELFTLGEGNYSEADIKEAARAFTGYRVRERTGFFFQKSLHDRGRKTIFGETGNWDGDDVINLAFRQPAARTFLIRELIQFYLTVDAVPEPYIEALGDRWANHGFELPYLIRTFFQSQLFFHPVYRGNLVKSPVQFYLGLCQDLKLDVVPFEARLIRSMDTMGQSFFNPPNVRGWLYGEHWINSTTVTARRQLVDYLFAGLNEKQLNANEKRTLEAVREAGKDNFLVKSDRLAQLLTLDPSDIAQHLATYFVTAPSRPVYQPVLEEILRSSKPAESLRHAVIALLQSPAYNLC